jgi:hypothetical protein
MIHRTGGLTAEEFVAKWSKAQLSERAASQEHFIDLCQLLGQPTPASADATGEDYCFEKHVKVVGSGSKGDYGFVDVWKRGYFAWEYKGKDKHKTLNEVYQSLGFDCVSQLTSAHRQRNAFWVPCVGVLADL